MQYTFNPITMSITIAITSITSIKVSILQQCPSLPSPSPSRLSHLLQLQSYKNVLHHRRHVYHMQYTFNPITMSITIAITSITCITVSILQQCPPFPSPPPSRLSHLLQLQSYKNVLHHRCHVYHMQYTFNLITMSITIAITSITCITA